MTAARQKKRSPAATRRIATKNLNRQGNVIPPLPAFQPDERLWSWDDVTDLQLLLGRLLGHKNTPFFPIIFDAPILLRITNRQGRLTGWLSCNVRHGFVAYGDTADPSSTSVFMLTPRDGHPRPKPLAEHWVYAAFVGRRVALHDIADGILKAEPC